MNDFDDAGFKILQYATLKFAKEYSDTFGNQMKELELTHQNTVEAIFKNPDVEEEFIENQFLKRHQSMPNPIKNRLNVNKTNIVNI